MDQSCELFSVSFMRIDIQHNIWTLIQLTTEMRLSFHSNLLTKSLITEIIYTKRVSNNLLFVILTLLLGKLSTIVNSGNSKTISWRPGAQGKN